MNEATRPTSLAQLNALFSRLNPQDVEQFYAIYQRWSLYQHMDEVQQKIAALCAQLGENAAQIEQVRPSAIALATLARLQASGVEDVELLDRMLERGEDWLDRTIQHLEYCEQTGVIGGDYEEWCRHALEDAFDWIDTVQSAAIAVPSNSTDTMDTTHTTDTAGTASSSNGSNDQPSSHLLIEELFLQKLMSEDGEVAKPTENAAATEEVGETGDAGVSVDQTGEKTLTLSEDTTLKIATVGTQSSALINDADSTQQPSTNGQTQPQNENGSAPDGAASLPTPASAAETDDAPEPVPTPVFPTITAPDAATPHSPSDTVQIAERDTLITPITDRDTALTPTANTGTSVSSTTGEETAGARFIAPAPTAGPKSKEQATHRRPGFLRRLLLALWR